jgi:hypothetical protein
LVARNNVYFSQYYIIDKPHQMWSNMKFANLMWQSVFFHCQDPRLYSPSNQSSHEIFPLHVIFHDHIIICNNTRLKS